MKVDENGQIIIPQQLCSKFGLEPGSNVEVEASKDGILIKPVASHRQQVVSWLKDEHGGEMTTLTTDQIMKLIH